LKANKKKLTAQLVEEPLPEPDKTFFDSRMKVPKVKRDKRPFRWVREGQYKLQGERIRANVRIEIERAELQELQQPDEGTTTTADEAIKATTLLTPKIEPMKFEEPLPDVEWWDDKFLKSGVYEDLDSPEDGLDLTQITLYVEHPVIIKPPFDIGELPPMPMFLTKTERKKLRRQTRMERQKDAQERVLLGIEPPPKPKVKISNLMRVLTNEAIQDPTQIEKEVRRQMAERQAAHEARNQARKLTPEERKAKKRRKLQEDTSCGTRVAVFRIMDLSHPKRRFKVEVNATDNYMSGCILMCPDMNLVIVEGGPKAIRKYKRLVTTRINWNSETAEEVDNKEKTSDEVNAGTTNGSTTEEKAEKKANACLEVWEGSVLKPAFRNFRIETPDNEALARKFLSQHQVAHYWDMALKVVPSLEGMEIN